MVKKAPQLDFMLKLGLRLLILRSTLIFNLTADDLDGKQAVFAPLKLSHLLDGAEATIAYLFSQHVVVSNSLAFGVAGDATCVCSISVRAAASGEPAQERGCCGSRRPRERIRGVPT